MKHKMIIVSGKGDTPVAEWEETDAALVAHAQGVFDQAVAEGFGAVKSVSGGTEALETFDPAVEEILLLRPIAGG